MKKTKVLIGLSTGEHIRRADFLPPFLALEKPPECLMTTVHGQSPASSRNFIIQQALDNDCTHVFFVDDDMILPQKTLPLLLAHDLDCVIGLYLMRSYPHFPVAFDKQFPNGFNKFLYMKPEVEGLMEVTNGGLGCALIKIGVFRAMDKPWVTLGELQKDGWCDDVSFYNRMRAAGFKMYLDTNVQCGHMTSMAIYPNRVNGHWYSEYRNENGNVIFPQTIPSDEITREDEEKHMREPATVK